jgi:hypothetical protein
MGRRQHSQPKRGLSDWQQTPEDPHSVDGGLGEHWQFAKNPRSTSQKNCSGVAQSEGLSPDGSQWQPTYSVPTQT